VGFSGFRGFRGYRGYHGLSSPLTFQSVGCFLFVCGIVRFAARRDSGSRAAGGAGPPSGLRAFAKRPIRIRARGLQVRLGRKRYSALKRGPSEAWNSGFHRDGAANGMLRLNAAQPVRGTWASGADGPPSRATNPECGPSGSAQRSFGRGWAALRLTGSPHGPRGCWSREIVWVGPQTRRGDPECGPGGGANLGFSHDGPQKQTPVSLCDIFVSFVAGYGLFHIQPAN